MMEIDKHKLIQSIRYPEIYKQVSILLFFTVIMLSWSIYYYTFLVCISYMLPHLYNIWETLLLVTLTNSIQTKFSILNNAVRNQKRISTTLRKILPHTNPDISQKFKQQETALSILELQDIMQTHYKLTALAREINAFFESPILITIALNFEVITISVYYLVGSISEPPETAIPMLYTLVWPIFLSIEIIFIIKGCQGIITKVFIRFHVKSNNTSTTSD